jgi:Domain of unknown function (DUF5655)/Domain of unknown function (DUF4287)
VAARNPVNWKYHEHKSLRMVQSVIAGMKKKTGRSLEEWLKLVNQEGPASEKDRATWLMEEHGMGTNYAAWIAACSLDRSNETGSAEEYLQHAKDNVEKMFSGPKQHLRTIYDEILKYALTMGPDIRVSPCATIVPIYRKHVIAQIKPTTRTRIDLGLALKNAKVPKRLINTGGFEKKDRISHRIELIKPEDFDSEAKRWMKVAYDGDA